MKLFHHPSACSLAVHIVLIEAGLPYELVAVDAAKRTSDGRDFWSINPKGYVPTLEFDDGTVLTENVAILLHLADGAPFLLPEGALGRTRALEALVFMATEIHGHLQAFFYRDTPESEQAKARAALVKHFATISSQLGTGDFLFASRMTIADAYLYWALMWAQNFGIVISGSLVAYYDRLKTRPSIARMLIEEGLA